MSDLTLQRVKQTEYATYGRLGEFVTLELPWKNNERNVSCVPAGTYTAERVFSPNHGYTVFKLVDVPQRDDVEIHIGNLPRDSKGCILLGSKFGDVDYSDGRADGRGPGILGSHTAFRAFIAAHPDQRVRITILDVPQPPHRRTDMKFNWHGVTAAGVSVLALVSSPVVAGILPPKAAALVAALGIVYQAFSKPAVVAAPTEAQQAAASK